MPSLVAKTRWSALAGIVAGLGGAAATVLVARGLGPAGAGQVAYAAFVASTAAQVLGLAAPQVATRYLAALPAEDAAGLARWLARRVLLSALLACSAAGLAARALGQADAWATAALAAGMTLGAAGQGVLAGGQRFRRLAALSAVSAALQVAGVAAGGRLAGAAGAVVGMLAGQLPLALALGGGPGPRPPSDLRARVRAYALDAWVAGLVSLFAWSRLELYFLERSHGDREVALFSVGLTLVQLATQPALLLGGALLPHLAGLVGRGGAEAADASYAAATRLLAFVSFPACFGLAALAPALVPLLFGPGFEGAVAPAAVVAASAAVGTTATAGSALIYARERSRFVAVIGAAVALAAVGAFAVAIPRWGPVGAAVARGAVQLLGVAVGTAFLVRELRAPVPLRSVGRTAIAAAAAAAAGSAVLGSCGRTWAGALLAAAAIAAAYLACARALRVLEAGDAEALAGASEAFPEPWRGRARALLRAMAA